MPIWKKKCPKCFGTGKVKVKLTAKQIAARKKNLQ